MRIHRMDLIKISDKRKFCPVIVVMSILGICCASGQTSNLKQTLFTRISLPSTVLQTAGTMEEFPIFSKVACLQQADQRQWCHLACFSNNGICSLYDVSLPSNYETTNVDLTDLIKCYTDLPEGCARGNQYYPDGENLEENCMNITCTNKAWVTTDGGIVLQDCPADFVSVPGVGCIFIDKAGRSFDDAEQICQDLGARLVIPDDFEALRQHILCKHTGSHYRVGIFDSEWLDGRPVDADLWYPGEPSRTYQCGYMWHHHNQKLRDYPCNSLLYSICQLWS